jgi:hypothetical protein
MRGRGELADRVARDRGIRQRPELALDPLLLGDVRREEPARRRRSRRGRGDQRESGERGGESRGRESLHRCSSFERPRKHNSIAGARTGE